MALEGMTPAADGGLYPPGLVPLEELKLTITFTQYKAIEFILGLDTPKKRREALPALARRKRRGTRAAPVRRKQGEYSIQDLEVCERARNDAFLRGLYRATIWAIAKCDVRSGRVGDFREGKIHYLSRCDLADAAGFPVRVDDSLGKDRLRVRAYSLDHVIEQQIVAGLVFRHQEHQGRPLVHKLKPGVWAMFGAGVTRDVGLRKKRKKARQAEQEAQQREENDLRGREWPPEVRALVGALARSRTNDTDPYADREPPVPPPPRKPPT